MVLRIGQPGGKLNNLLSGIFEMSVNAKAAMERAARMANIAAASRELEDERQVADLVASVRWIHYQASLKKGFTPAQALVLCVKRTLE